MCGLSVLFISGFAFYLITRDQDFGKLKSILSDADMRWLICGAFLVIVFVLLESVQLNMLFNGMNCHKSFGKCALLSNVGFFFCQITPSASGGQPMQVVYMNLIGIDVLLATLTCMIITVIYKLVLILLFLLSLLVRPALVYGAISDVTFLFVVGLLLQIGFMVFLMVCVFRPSLAASVLDSLITLGVKTKILKNPEKWRIRADDSLRRYTQASNFLRNNKQVMLKMILLTTLQRLAYFTVTFCVAKALNVRNCNWFSIVAIQIVLSLAVDVFPIPGSAGLNEYVFLDLQDKLFGSGLVSAGVILNRGLTFFLLIVITGIFTIIATIYFNKIQHKYSEETESNS